MVFRQGYRRKRFFFLFLTLSKRPNHSQDVFMYECMQRMQCLSLENHEMPSEISECSTLQRLAKTGSVIKELIGNSWSKEKKVPPCVTSKYPAWHVCTGSSLVSRSSSSNIKGIQLQLRCLSASKSWSHTAKKNNSVFSPSQCPMFAYGTAQLVNIPEFRVGAAIKPSLLWESHVYGVLQKNFKAPLP